jgi:hypothetical protein
MKRTILPITPLFDIPKSERITNQGTTTLKKDVERILLPELKKFGYEGKLINYKEVEKVRTKNVYYEEGKGKPSIPPKDLFLHETSGFFLMVQERGRKSPILLMKPFVRPTIDDVTDIPRLNLETETVRGMMTYAVPEARIKAILHSVSILNLHFIIMTETKQFWIGRFADIPENLYFLTWRHQKGVLDRLAVKSKAHETGQFHSTKSRLANDLKLYMYPKKS